MFDTFSEPAAGLVFGARIEATVCSSWRKLTASVHPKRFRCMIDPIRKAAKKSWVTSGP
jgi:hypothetical protein